MAASSVEIFKKFYGEGKYSEASNSLKIVIRERKKNENGVVRFTEEEASFLWASANEQFQSKSYDQGSEFCDGLFQDLAYVKSHPGDVVTAGLWLAYNGHENDYVKGMEYFLKAAVCTPHPSAYEAMKHLGFMYEYGQGVEVDPDKALSYYDQSAKGGYPEGCYCFGLYHYSKLYPTSLEQTQDAYLEHLGKAAIWLEKAAELGYKKDPELTSKRLDCWKRLQQVHLTLVDKYKQLFAQHQQCVQNCSDKLKQIQGELAGNMVAQSEQEVVTPAEAPVVLVNPGSGRKEEKKEEVASTLDNPTAKDLTKGPAMFANSAAKTAAPLKKDQASEEKKDLASGGWNTVGRGKKK